VALKDAQWSFGNGATIEALEPFGPETGFMHRFLASRGPGIHHCTFEVKDIVKASEWVKSQGYEVIGFNDSDPTWKEFFIHPKQALGIVVQIAYEQPGLSAYSKESISGLLPIIQNIPPPADIYGIHMIVHSKEAMRKLWGSLLGGKELVISETNFCYSWPNSPLVINVKVDPSQREGPVGVEVLAKGKSLDSSDTSKWNSIFGNPFIFTKSKL